MEIKRTRKIIFTAITGIMTGFLYAAGSRLDTQDTLDLRDSSFYADWLMLSGLAALIIFGIWHCADKLTKKLNHMSSREGQTSLLKQHLLYTGILMLCWLPALLSIFPGVFSYDAYAEWEAVRTGVITSHHPVLHVLLVGGLLEGFYKLTGSYNVGICIYAILQMLLMANVLALTVGYMKKRGIGRPGRILTMLFYGLSPVFQLFAICTTKDVLFTACELLFMIFVLRLTGEREQFFASKGAQAGFVLTVLGTMILRNNGLYIALIMLLILFFFCGEHRKRYAVLSGVILLLYGIYVGPIYCLLSVTPPKWRKCFPCLFNRWHGCIVMITMLWKKRIWSCFIVCCRKKI